MLEQAIQRGSRFGGPVVLDVQPFKVQGPFARLKRGEDAALMICRERGHGVAAPPRIWPIIRRTAKWGRLPKALG
jgi:hypothetical protein